MTKRIYNLIVEKLPSEQLDFLQLAEPHYTLPKFVDLRRKMPRVYDQGSLGSCTANAVCGVVGYVKPSISYGSRLFLYYNSRKLENNIPDDAGSTLATSIKALQKYGVCREKEWEYNIDKFAIEPPKSCYTNALQNTALQVKHIPTKINAMKNSLHNGYPFVVGFMVYDSFESETVSNTGYVPMPRLTKETLLGGHAAVCVGYDDNKKVWIMRNSWGKEWGDNGHFYLPYPYLTKDFASDFWTIIKMK